MLKTVFILPLYVRCINLDWPIEIRVLYESHGHRGSCGRPIFRVESVLSTRSTTSRG